MQAESIRNQWCSFLPVIIILGLAGCCTVFVDTPIEPLPVKMQKAWNEGASAALKDMEKGILGYKPIGHIERNPTAFRKKMKEYGIIVERKAFCIVGEETGGFVDGYNYVMRQNIISKFGRDVTLESGDQSIPIKELYEKDICFNIYYVDSLLGRRANKRKSSLYIKRRNKRIYSG